MKPYPTPSRLTSLAAWYCWVSLAAPLGLMPEDKVQHFCSLKMLEGSRPLLRKKLPPENTLSFFRPKKAIFLDLNEKPNLVEYWSTLK